MNIVAYSKKKIMEGLERARNRHREKNDQIKVLFAPVRINHDNFDRACNIYSRLEPNNYDTVVIVESYDKILDKKLPMPSNKVFKTSLGDVKVNDYLRNEFCDEDDDFFIHDEGYSRDMSLFQQLMMLQCVLDDFSALSVQIADMGPAIVKELAYVLEEVLASRNALLVFCCELDNTRKNEFKKIRKMIEEDNQSGLMNYLNSGESRIEGTTTFIAGILVAREWELNLNFLDKEYDDYKGSLISAYAERQKVLF